MGRRGPSPWGGLGGYPFTPWAQLPEAWGDGTFSVLPPLSATERGFLRLVFLTRPGCHLCDDARPLVLAAAAAAGAVVEERNVELDDRLLANYGLRIPVVLAPDGSVVAEGIIRNGKELAAAIRRLPS